MSFRLVPKSVTLNDLERLSHLLMSSCYSGFPCLFWSLVTRTGRTAGPILTIDTSYDVFPPKDVPFGNFVDIAAHFGGKIPQTPNL